MTAMNMIQALNSALEVMLERDPDVLIFGGVFRVTDGLQQRHGESRASHSCPSSSALSRML